MIQRCVSLDKKSEELLDKLVPDIYPSRSELFRDLIRKEYERLRVLGMVE